MYNSQHGLPVYARFSLSIAGLYFRKSGVRVFPVYTMTPRSIHIHVHPDVCRLIACRDAAQKGKRSVYSTPKRFAVRSDVEQRRTVKARISKRDYQKRQTAKMKVHKMQLNHMSNNAQRNAKEANARGPTRTAHMYDPNFRFISFFCGINFGPSTPGPEIHTLH